MTHTALEPAYLDASRPIAERVNDLLARMTLEEKAGQMFHAISFGGADVDPETQRLITEGQMSHFNVHQLPDARSAARWHNRMQELASGTRLGIPITVSTDPRHAFAENQGASFAAGFFSAWPEPIGMAALGDPETVRRFADTARQEYLAVGLRAALHPTVDLATEPRWARQYSGFGQDPELTGKLAAAYLEGFQGNTVGSQSVACMTKHFPGGGPQKDGEDPHFPYGREQVYPGGRFEDHLLPFRDAIAAGTSAIMPYYGMPVGLSRNGEPIEEVGFGFNRQIITGLLRGELGYDGVVCTDWGLLHDVSLFGLDLPARAWGVERLSVEERMIKVIEAGCDQFGGESCPEILVGLVKAGRITSQRIDESVRRLLRVKFELGLFENRYVDEDAAAALVGNAQFREEGLKAQSRSVVVLKTSEGILPLQPSTRVYVEGMPADSIQRRASVVATPEEADLALVRLDAPFEPRNDLFLEAMFHAGSLEFDDAAVEHLQELAAQVPVVLVVNLDRPAILTPLEPHCSAVLATFGVSDEALIRVLAGTETPEGRLPFELPRSTEAVLGAQSDVPGGTRDPLYAYGHGLGSLTQAAISVDIRF
ncbi:glycoside hydrolase family 3 C-terminal domain-containing protein [Pseudarthrobacter sp. R1]|uniref:glycoside hydrolase family 3 protein n=1 Tax=Pseudarthrobacter sp. R1 TaxID=2944934 RepID=UPI00210D9041|nr:glycoside hydrolase family 3 N-terminal domain-containing protein [Pseudarthrobacter sp. R1]MCQ6272228.1 glycoside hydrolase family 3 C-terminal domain-containing protein [Pseudarthrobacter sp. R1]